MVFIHPNAYEHLFDAAHTEMNYNRTNNTLTIYLVQYE
jgi:hypothetical protein